MQKITKSSTAEYFSKNLQQVGFSSPKKAVLTVLKEAIDNSLDACEDTGVLPQIKARVQREGPGSSRNTDLISIMVEDNGPGLEEKNIQKVFGEYLVSSKFGLSRCSRGQQGIGISAATTWAQLTTARGVHVTSKTKNMKKAVSVTVDMDIKNNKGILRDKKTVDMENPRGLRLEFLIEGRIQLKGEGGLIAYLEGTALLNPHLEMEYQLLDQEPRKIPRVSSIVPKIPPPALPHPHTMKLGEFLRHAGLYGRATLKKFLKTGFSRVTDSVLRQMIQEGLKPKLLSQPLTGIGEAERKKVFSILHKIPLANPSTKSVLAVGEEGLAESVHRLGEIDFFSVVTRKPRICDYKSVVVEVAIARLKAKGGEEDSAQLLRFANRVPLQFDKSSCAITKAAESVNWRAYGLSQSKKSLPLGPYVFAVSVTSPFIKFKNASKETIDGSEELVEEIRLSLMRAGQKLKTHIRKEKNTEDLLRKKQYIEKFAPILIRKIKDITGAGPGDIKKAELGLDAILSKDAKKAEKALDEANLRLEEMKSKRKRGLGLADKEPKAKSEEGEEGEEAQGGDQEALSLISPNDEDPPKRADKPVNSRQTAYAKNRRASRKKPSAKLRRKSPASKKPAGKLKKAK